MSGAPNGSVINLDTMSLDQLNTMKQQNEQRLQGLMSQFQQLRSVSARLTTARQAISSIPTSAEGREIMIPLTESLYAPGRIVQSDKFVCDLGADFFVEKSSKDAVKLLERRSKVVDANSNNVTAAAEATQANVRAINSAMQGKILEIQARQKGMAYKKQEEAAA
mmetsp:Transcript_15832/g.36473  ORF Transcript_15832/g.36473 Transcript_15832/m.36473 type:complete len:165 (-) Transcript_15832:136-630(-)